MKFYQTHQFRMYALGFIILASISFGYAVRPGIELVLGVASDIFAINDKREMYVAPPSEYETKVNELWQSAHHQAVCKANAAATVSLQLARKYLDESEKQSALSQYDTPLSEVIQK